MRFTLNYSRYSMVLPSMYTWEVINPESLGGFGIFVFKKTLFKKISTLIFGG